MLVSYPHQPRPPNAMLTTLAGKEKPHVKLIVDSIAVEKQKLLQQLNQQLVLVRGVSPCCCVCSDLTNHFLSFSFEIICLQITPQHHHQQLESCQHPANILDPLFKQCFWQTFGFFGHFFPSV